MPEVVVDVGTGEDEMSNGTVADLTVERAELIVAEVMQADQSLAHNGQADEAAVFNIARNSSVKKFNEVGEIESAAATVIMSKAS